MIILCRSREPLYGTFLSHHEGLTSFGAHPDATLDQNGTKPHPPFRILPPMR